MKTTKDESTLGFELLPTHTDGIKFDLTPETVAILNNNLTLLDIHTATKNLQASLGKILVANLSPQELFEMLNVLKPAIGRIYHGLKKIYLNQAIQPQNIATIQTGQMIQDNVILGYKRMLDKLVQDKLLPRRDKNKLILIAICRILKYSHLQLLRYYQFYTNPPKKFWQELYIVYTFAAKHKLLDKGSPYSKHYSIKDRFKKIFLLAAINANQYQQSDMELINQVIYDWLPFAKLRVATSKDLGVTDVFLLDLAHGTAPQASTLKTGTGGLEKNKDMNYLALDLTKLKKHIDRVLRDAANKKLKPKHALEYDLPTRVLRKLYRQQESPVTGERWNKNAEPLEVVFGYTAVHYFVNNQELSHTKFTAEAAKKGGVKPQYDYVFEDDEPEVKPATTSMPPMDSEQRPNATAKFPIYKYPSFELAEGGNYLKFVCTSEAIMFNSKPGNLICFKTKASDSWELGIITWLELVNDNEFLICAKQLKIRQRPAAITGISKQTTAKIFYPCYLLVDDNNNLLIMTIPLFQEHNHATLAFSLDGVDKFVNIQLKNKQYETNAFKEFSFTIEKDSIKDEENIRRFISGSAEIQPTTAGSQEPAPDIFDML